VGKAPERKVSLVSTRRATKDDLRFVAATWFKSVWKNSPSMSLVGYEDFKPGFDRLLNRRIDNGRVTIAFPPDNPGELAGFAVHEGHTLHFAYVRNVYRRLGIGGALVRSLLCEKYSYDMGKLGLLFAEKMKLRYDPFPVE
jgi:hypothetical protein